MLLPPMPDLYEIFESWKISFSPTEKQQEIAEERIRVCNECDYKEYLAFTYICGACGCPLKKKVYSPKGKTACPLKKWER